MTYLAKNENKTATLDIFVLEREATEPCSIYDDFGKLRVFGIAFGLFMMALIIGLLCGMSRYKKLKYRYSVLENDPNEIEIKDN